MKWRLIGSLLFVVVALCVWSHLLLVSTVKQAQFPFGHRPGAAELLSQSLRVYAFKHEGKFPVAEPPQLALLKLFPGSTGTAHTIAGISGDVRAVQDFLLKGGNLEKSSISWIYFMGYSEMDTNAIVAAERCQGIGGNGMAMSERGRIAIYADGQVRIVEQPDWNRLFQRSGNQYRSD